jgi:hypothetical protein
LPELTLRYAFVQVAFSKTCWGGCRNPAWREQIRAGKARHAS